MYLLSDRAIEKGEPFDTSELKGKVVLVVNTASKCGFTPQYAGLETLYKSIKEKEHGKDFEILGFPCNQFGGQEPGSNDDVQNFCQVNYGVTFPIMGKTEVNGNNADPLYQWLKKQQKQLGMERIKWNFEKFLVNRKGEVVARFSPDTVPTDAVVIQAIERELPPL